MADTSGKLEETPFAKIFAECAFVRRFSGAVELQTTDGAQRVSFREGTPVFVSTPMTFSPLGRVLSDHYRVPEDVVNKALVRLTKEKRLLGELLLEMGAVTRETLDAALITQTRLKLLRLFRYTSGEYVAHEGVEHIGGNEVRGVVALPLLLAAARGSIPLAQVKVGLTELRSKAVVLTPAGRVTLEGVALDAEAARVAECLRQPRRIEDMVKGLDLHDSDVDGVVFGLMLAGCLESRPGGMARPIAAATEAASASKGPDPSLVKAVQDRAKAVNGANHFEVLDLPVEADAAAVKKSYLQLAMSFHPDRVAAMNLEAHRKEVEQVYVAITAAYEALINDESRERYKYSLAAASSDSKVPEVRPEEARLNYDKAVVYHRKKEPMMALSHLQMALKWDPSLLVAATLKAWIEYQQSPNDAQVVKTATAELKKICDADKKSEAPPYYLGVMLRAQGETDTAAKLFERVLKLNPRHVEAQRELRLHEMRLKKQAEEQQTKKKPGLFGFLKK